MDRNLISLMGLVMAGVGAVLPQESRASRKVINSERDFRERKARERKDYSAERIAAAEAKRARRIERNKRVAG